MSNKSVDLIEQIAAMGLEKPAIKAVIIDYKMRKRLTHEETIELFRKFRLSGV